MAMTSVEWPGQGLRVPQHRQGLRAPPKALQVLGILGGHWGYWAGTAQAVQGAP